MPRLSRLKFSPLRLAELEPRDCPALNIIFDYGLDTSGFFQNPTVRQTFEDAARSLVSRIDSNLAAIVPQGRNTWEAIVRHPSTNQNVSIPNLTIPENTIVIYAGGMTAAGPEAGLGGPGGFRATGSTAFQNTVRLRGQNTIGLWGGSVSFETQANWYTGLDPAGLRPGQIDFHSVATHELAHLLGFGTANSWFTNIQGASFTGPQATRLHGGPVPLSADRAHFAQGTLSNGLPVSMRPVMDSQFRVPFSELEYAALADLGWVVSGFSTAAALSLASTPTPLPNTIISAASQTSPIVGAPEISHPALTVGPDQVSVMSNPLNGTVQVFTSVSGQLRPAGSGFSPFSGFLGEVRSAVADVNADGVADLIFGTGPGGGSRIRVLDGKTFKDVAPNFLAFESSYTGGVFVAAADFDGDGRAEVIVTPDQGGGGRVQITRINNGSTQVVADFFGINDPNFRGGARATAGDLNGDGRPDLIVGAGTGGGPRVAIFHGATLFTTRSQLIGDFFAFESTLRDGVYITVGDLEGDGVNDLIFGAGPGGAPRVLAINAATLLQRGPTTAINQPTANGFVGDTSQRGGVRIVAKDLDGNGKKELLTASGNSSDVRIFNNVGGTFVPQAIVTPFGSIVGPSNGVFVG